MNLSVIIPVYNSQASIGRLVEALQKEFSGEAFDIILVNDGSQDQSEMVCTDLAQLHSNVSLISLRKNFGEHHAVLCGLNFCTASYAVIVDDDFQNPPSEIRKLLNTAEAGNYDVVYAQYAQKKHSFFRNLGSRINDKMANHILQKPKDLYLSSFKLIRQEIVAEIIRYKGPFPYIDGLILRVTRNIGTAEVQHLARAEGKSSYTIKKLISLYLNMFFNFSVRPLRWFTLIGGLIFLIGMICSLIFVIEKLIYPDTPAGWTSIIIAIITLSGFQIVFLGLIGEYIGKLYLDQNSTPQWVIKKHHKSSTSKNDREP